jgi:hypothetical protein
VPVQHVLNLVRQGRGRDQDQGDDEQRGESATSREHGQYKASTDASPDHKGSPRPGRHFAGQPPDSAWRPYGPRRVNGNSFSTTCPSTDSTRKRTV